MEDIEKAIIEFEKEINIPSGFFYNLLIEDDWSFVIKIHAFIEALVSFLIIKALGKEDLTKVISFLELSNNRTGKLAFVKSLNLLNKDYRRFIKTLSEIRNGLTHNVSNVGISIEHYCLKLNKQKRDEYIKGISLGKQGSFEINGKKTTYVNFVRENMRIGIWFACMDLVSEAQTLKVEAQLKEAYLKMGKAMAKIYDGVNSKDKI